MALRRAVPLSLLTTSLLAAALTTATGPAHAAALAKATDPAYAATLAAATGPAHAAATTTNSAQTAVTGVAAAASTGTTGFRNVDITASDGVDLKANVIEPTTPGRHPAIVFISSWGLNDAEYLVQATDFAQAGYTVLSYTTRGFYNSGGQIDTAGPKDIADVSSVVTWLLANTTADPAHVGVAGVSYGAGISLIASAFDPRIKAVAAMSAWSDLVYSLYADNTRHPQAAFLLQAAAEITGHPSAELTQMLNDYFSDQNIDAVLAWGRVRSAATYLPAINANHPAIMIANAYGDSLFGPNQLVDFFGKLTGPKRLEFAPGDHAVVEATGLIGLDNHVWTSVHRWFDQYLSNVDTGIATEPPVVLRVRESGNVEQYADWSHVTGSTQRYSLGAVPWYTGTGPLASSTASGWTQSIWTGLDTTADAGVVLLSNGLEALTGVPPTDWLPSVSRVNGAVWQSDVFASGTSIRGIPSVHLSLSAPPATGTLIAYLYDEDATGTGGLIANAPVTWLASTGALDWSFPATAYDVPAGHRLALVLDTKDPLYLDANSGITPITVAGPSWITVPMK